MKVRVVWLIRGADSFAPDWLRELFTQPRLEYEFMEDGGRNTIIPGAVVVFNQAVDYVSYFARCQASGSSFGAVHL